MTTSVAQTETTEGRFGTFGGVFTPTLLTILGAVMYLRTGYVVGSAGLLGAVIIIGLANLITISTGLSIASIATNIRVKEGGAFSIISQSLGLEVGGSVSVPFYLAQSLGVSFYVFAFTEGWQRIFPDHPAWLVVFGCFAVAFIISWISAGLAVRAQFFILILIGLSLVSVFLGSFVIDASGLIAWLGIEGVALSSAGFTQTPMLAGNYQGTDFWGVFAVFFPAVTGILAGVNMSGELKNPRRSIPRGTLLAQVLSFSIYLLLSYWLTRVATPEELTSNLTVVVDKALIGPLVLLGLLAATFSSALTSMVGAPRILQAIAQYGVLPRGEAVAKLSANGEPRNAMLVTGGIVISALIFGLVGGGLNAIAPLLTMFFLITYSTLNGVVLLEQTMGLISFRPSLRVPVIVPMIGLVGSLFVMFLINPAFSLISLVVIVALYAYLTTRQLHAPWSDVRSGLFVTLAEWAATQVGMASMEQGEERAWKPNVMVPVTSSQQLVGAYRFIYALTHPRGSVRVLGIYPPGQPEAVRGLAHTIAGFERDGVFAQMSTVEVSDLNEGLGLSLDVLSTTFFRPNVVLLPVNGQNDDDVLETIVQRARRNRIGVLFYLEHPSVRLGREQTINVWIRERSPDWPIDMRLGNFHLSLLMAYQISLNWQGRIRLISVVREEGEVERGKQFLDQLVELSRMPRGTETVCVRADWPEYIMKDARRADLDIFGVQEHPQVTMMQELTLYSESSCLFVRDSGLESALA